MNQTLSPPEGRHRVVDLLLPWYVTRQLDQADQAMVAEHLETCEPCRAALAAEQVIARAVATDADAAEPR